MRITLILSALLLASACGKDDATDATDSGSTDSGSVDMACADFCGTYVTTCTEALAEWDDTAACEADCGDWELGTVDDADGDTLECRTYHLGVAATDAETHCPHAGPSGGEVCVD
jgi:hypothetical protein